ncbi:hypothetical protein BC826DRAFT_975701 [Russula brevipes]|nr:hypothetical protein BC826DRAFT_975701 [Russula brevipes]
MICARRSPIQMYIDIKKDDDPTDFFDIPMDGIQDPNELDEYLSQSIEKVRDPVAWWSDHTEVFRGCQPWHWITLVSQAILCFGDWCHKDMVRSVGCLPAGTVSQVLEYRTVSSPTQWSIESKGESMRNSTLLCKTSAHSRHEGLSATVMPPREKHCLAVQKQKDCKMAFKPTTTQSKETSNDAAIAAAQPQLGWPKQKASARVKTIVKMVAEDIESDSDNGTCGPDATVEVVSDGDGPTEAISDDNGPAEATSDDNGPTEATSDDNGPAEATSDDDGPTEAASDDDSPITNLEAKCDSESRSTSDNEIQGGTKGCSNAIRTYLREREKEPHGKRQKATAAHEDADIVTNSKSCNLANLKEDIAKNLNVHPNNLNVQYKFSNEAQKAIPIPLTSATDLKMLNEHLQLETKGQKRPVSVIIMARDSANTTTTTGTSKDRNLWAAFHLENPEKYPLDKKPDELNYLCNGTPWGVAVSWCQQGEGGQAQHLNPQPQGPQQQLNFSLQAPVIYGMLHHMMQMAAGLNLALHTMGGMQPGLGIIPGTSNAPPGLSSVTYPSISGWLQYCDAHPNHSSHNFVCFKAQFEEEGYCHINQLSSGRIDIKDLAELLNVGRGLADLIQEYVKEDIARVQAGVFSMNEPDRARFLGPTCKDSLLRVRVPIYMGKGLGGVQGYNTPTPSGALSPHACTWGGVRWGAMDGPCFMHPPCLHMRKS